ncbi:hypothetical protein F8M41_000090 [Gigaspora margarita]|uniref:Uncharacterized protein n=1 Tax=Gigaspora margarita TaxID=4874 RepID=A0A8H4B5J3_GIGMA|nr:hypothetical protein F8M41_000090 [Gigaspora margarita]
MNETTEKITSAKNIEDQKILKEKYEKEIKTIQQENLNLQNIITQNSLNYLVFVHVFDYQLFKKMDLYHTAFSPNFCLLHYFFKMVKCYTRAHLKRSFLRSWNKNKNNNNCNNDDNNNNNNDDNNEEPAPQ